MSVIGKDGDFDSVADRSSEDNETRLYLASLIKDGVVTLKDALIFFNYGCEFYKKAQNLYQISDGKINIEFQYAARAFASFLNNESDDRHKSLALLDAFQASRHIVNDSLDLILSFIRKELTRSEHISSNKKIEQVVDGFEAYKATLSKIEKLVEESRRKRGMFRYEVYLDTLHGSDYEKLCTFLDELKTGVRKLIGERRREVKEDRKFVTTLFLTFFGLVFAGLVSVLVVVFDTELKSDTTRTAVKCFFSKEYCKK